MAVVSALPCSVTGGITRAGHRYYDAVWKVRTDSRTDGLVTVLLDSALPVYLYPFVWVSEWDYGAFRKEISGQLTSEEGTLKLWTVTLHYDSEPLPEGRHDSNRRDDPRLWPIDISGDFLVQQVPLEKDRTGAAVTNSAGDLFEGRTRDASFPTLVLTKNYSDIDLDYVAQYRDSVNTETFFGLIARKWKLGRVAWQQLRHGLAMTYYRVTFEFSANYDTWDFVNADRGYWYKDGSNRRRFTDDVDGVTLTGQGCLNGSGAKLAVAGTIVDITDRVYPERAYSGLRIPMSLSDVLNYARSPTIDALTGV